MESEPSAPRRYSVVELPTGAVFTVASNWIEDVNTLHYPKAVKGQVPKRMVLSCVDLPASISEEKWLTYNNFKILHSYDKFMVAEKAAKKACDTSEISSNVDTDYSKPRRRKMPAKFCSSSAESDSDSPDSPVRPVKHSKRVAQLDSSCEDLDEIEHLVQLKRNQMESKKKESKKKPGITKLSCVSSPQVRDSEVTGCSSQALNVVKDIFSGNSAGSSKTAYDQHLPVRAEADYSPPSISSPTSPANSLEVATPRHTYSSDKENIDPLANSSSHKRGNNSAPQILRGQKGNQVFTFGKSTSFEQAAPTLEKLLSALVNSNHELLCKMDFIDLNISSIMETCCPEEVIERPEGSLPKRPLISENDFETFNSYLESRPNRKAVVALMVLEAKRHKKVEDATRAILKAFISSPLSRLMSWQGSCGLKVKVDDTPFLTTVESALMKRFPDVDLGSVHKTIKRWFNIAFQRKS